MSGGNIERLTVLKYCEHCDRDCVTHELVCSCGNSLFTVIHSALTGERVTRVPRVRDVVLSEKLR